MSTTGSKICHNREEAKEFINEMISSDSVVVFSKVTCPYCHQAKQALNKEKIKYVVVNLTGRSDCSIIQDALLEMTGARTVPRVFIHQKCIGGGSETSSLQKQNRLRALVDEKPGQ